MTQGQFKKDFAELVQKRFEKATKKDANAMLEDLISYIAKNSKKEKVNIPGLGIFTVRSRPARMGRNPQTGAKIKIKASKKIAFRPSKAFKEATGTAKAPAKK
jgi:nucleoid DNA-binding protein